MDNRNETENYLTVRLLMQGKEVGSIIVTLFSSFSNSENSSPKQVRGDNIKSIRILSGAHINISYGSTPERIVTLTGTAESLCKAFSMICQKFDEDLQQTCSSVPPLIVRLVVPATQCGSIIGKGGMKIKEMRESTGASIQVASEMLPQSTERAVTISGGSESINNCFKEICNIMLDSPPKGDTLLYRPPAPPSSTPIFLINGQAFQVHGQYPIPLSAHDVGRYAHMNVYSPYPGFLAAPSATVPDHQPKAAVMKPLTSPACFPLLAPIQYPGYVTAVSPGSYHLQQCGLDTVRQFQQMHQTKEITIANDLIGCVIGRGGQKISEIRHASGANIKIADLEEGCLERRVTISGTLEQISLAEVLIQSRIASEIGGIIIAH